MDDAPGQGLFRFNLYATMAFVGFAFAAAAFPGPLRIAFAVFSCVLFAVGTLGFLWAYGKALERSRNQEVSVAMIFGMSGVAPKTVQRRFHMLTAVQLIVGMVTAGIRPFTAQAFGILASMLGIGLAGVWSARHGTFAKRRDRRMSRESKNNG